MRIYTDESGFWGHNDSPYYVRSWVAFTKRGLEQVKLLFDNFSPDSEIKWTRSHGILESKYLPRVECYIFVTVTALDSFRNQNFRIINAIESLDDSIFTGYKSMDSSVIKSKMIDSTKQILFLSYQEKQHLHNAINSFVSKGAVINGIIFDVPQFTGSLYKEMVSTNFANNRLSNVQFKLEKSKDHRALQYADLISSSVNEFLTSSHPSDRTLVFLRNVVKPRMLDMSNRNYPNPNMIYWDPQNTELLAKFNDIRDL